jgi:hypothetical protein
MTVGFLLPVAPRLVAAPNLVVVAFRLAVAPNPVAAVAFRLAAVPNLVAAVDLHQVKHRNWGRIWFQG